MSLSESEHIKFIGHRSDQSAFSLITKKYGYRPSKLNLPNGVSLKSRIRGLTEPIWISRNRTGQTIIPKWIQRLP
jgi:hypothetical protein